MLAIMFAISAFFMKISDDIVDNGIKEGRIISSISGTIYGLIFGYLLIKSEYSAYVVASIVIGCLLAKKVDSLPHYIALAIIFFFTVVFGVPQIDPFLLIVFSLAGFIDEYDRRFKNSFLNFMFEYRFFLKAAFLFYSLISGIYKPLFYIFVFDISYYLTQAFASKKIINFCKSMC